jgi:hypothetical protein
MLTLIQHFKVLKIEISDRKEISDVMVYQKPKLPILQGNKEN